MKTAMLKLYRYTAIAVAIPNPISAIVDIALFKEKKIAEFFKMITLIGEHVSCTLPL